MTPEVQYARNGDTALAYQVVGDGPVDVAFLTGFVSNLDLAWDYPPYARFLRRLAGFSRLISHGPARDRTLGPILAA